MTILERIKSLCRNIKKISITTLEQELGYSNGSLSKAKDIPSSRIIEIADFFGVSTDYLLTGKEPNSYSPELANLIIKIQKDKALVEALIKYFNFTDEQKKHVIDTINLLERV